MSARLISPKVHDTYLFVDKIPVPRCRSFQQALPQAIRRTLPSSAVSFLSVLSSLSTHRISIRCIFLILYLIPPTSHSQWLPRSLSSTTPCTATSSSWPRLRRPVLRRPAALPTSSRSPRPSPRMSSPRCTLLPSPPMSLPSTTPPSLRATMLSFLVSPPVTETSPPSGRLSGTRLASSGLLVVSGARWPVSSSLPPPRVVVKRPLLRTLSPPSLTTASSMSPSVTPRLSVF